MHDHIPSFNASFFLGSSFFFPQTAVSFLKMYKAEDLIVVNINGASASSWDVSPPSRNGLREHLLSMNVVEFRYAYSFKR